MEDTCCDKELLPLLITTGEEKVHESPQHEKMSPTVLCAVH